MTLGIASLNTGRRRNVHLIAVRMLQQSGWTHVTTDDEKFTNSKFPLCSKFSVRVESGSIRHFEFADSNSNLAPLIDYLNFVPFATGYSNQLYCSYN